MIFRTPYLLLRMNGCTGYVLVKGKVSLFFLVSWEFTISKIWIKKILNIFIFPNYWEGKEVRWLYSPTSFNLTQQDFHYHMIIFTRFLLHRKKQGIKNLNSYWYLPTNIIHFFDASPRKIYKPMVVKAPVIVMVRSDQLRILFISGIPKTTPTPLRNRTSAKK